MPAKRAQNDSSRALLQKALTLKQTRAWSPHPPPAAPPLRPPGPPPSTKRRKGARGTQGRSCRVPGCTAALEPGYCEAYRICRTHHRADSFQMDGNTCRYCQQCGKIHCLTEFDKGRQSCRMSLSRHQRARLLRQLRDTSATGRTRGQASKAGKKRGREGKLQPQAKAPSQPAAAAAPAATAASTVGPAPPAPATCATSCLAPQLSAPTWPPGVPVSVPQLLLLEDRLQPTTPRVSLQSVLPGTMHAALLAKATRPRPPPTLAAPTVAVAVQAAAPRPLPAASIEQPVPQHSLPSVAAGVSTEDHAPLVPEVLHPVPCQPGPPFPPQPRPDLVHRALEMLNSPNELGSGEMPSVDELLNFNAQLGLRLHSDSSSSSDLPLLLDVDTQPRASKRIRLAGPPPPAVAQSLVLGAASDPASQASHPKLHLTRTRSTATQAARSAAEPFIVQALADPPRKQPTSLMLGVASHPLQQPTLRMPLAACSSLDVAYSLPLHATPLTPDGNCGGLPSMLLGSSFVA